MIDYKHKDLFWGGRNVQKDLTLKFSGGDIITNEDIFKESMEIKESLCSEQQLKFGCCEASQFKIKIAHSFTSHIGQTLDVSMTLNGDTENPFQLGRYKVVSDVPTADRIYRDITAYDSMYDIINADVSSWYDKILPNEKSEVSLKEFRDSFFEFLGVEQEECSLVNDNAKIKRTINTNEALSGKEVVCAICEINGTFGHIGRNGKFKYVTLKGLRDTLYPASDLYPSEDLYPAQPMYSTHIATEKYKSCSYEDYECKQISKLVIREKSEDLGTIYGNGDNTYIIQGNFLVFGKGADEMYVIANHIYDVIWDTRYLPANISAVGNPCIEVGDGLNLNTRFKTVYTYALQRTLKGIQALSDDFTATGKEKYEEKVNGTSRQIEQLTSRTRTLTQDVEKVESKFENYSTTEEMSSAISQSATEIKTEVSKTYSTKEEVSSAISQSAEEINTEVSKKVGNDEIISKINQSAEQISINANKINLNGYVTATDLKTGGKTTINGANITTGDISCDRLNGGTIKGQTINGGTITLGETAKRIFIHEGELSLGESGKVSSYYETDNGWVNRDFIVFAPNPKRNGAIVDIVANQLGIKASGSSAQLNLANPDGDIGIYSGGDIYANVAGTPYINKAWATGSDRNIKHDINKLAIDKSSDFIYSLNPVEYIYNDDEKEQVHHGFIAQEVHDVMDSEWGVYFDGETKGIRYEEIIADLVATVQEQKREIEEMKSEIKELKGAR